MDSELIDEFGAEFGRVDWGGEYRSLSREFPRIFGSGLRDDAWRATYSPFASQQAYHSLVARYKGFSGPVGSGKSAALCREAIRLALENPGCDGLIGAPTYRMLADVTRPAFRRALREAGIDHEFRAGDNLVYIPAVDAKVLFRSLSDPERLVGTNLAWFGVDELTYCKQNSWERLEARLREPRARRLCGFAVWTPKGFDWVYHRFVNADRRLPGYDYVRAKPGENTALDPSYYESLKHSYDARFYAQEVLGEYLNIFAGQAYYAFDRARNVAKVEFDWRRPLGWSMDFNVSRMSSVLLQYIPRPGDQPELVSVLDEIVLQNSNTEATCFELLERLDRLTAGTPMERDQIQIRVYGDAAGESRTSKADKTDYEIIRRFGQRHAERVNFSFHVQDANPSIRARVASVNSMLANEAGDARLIIDPRCQHLIADLEQVGWLRDKHGNEQGEFDKTNPALTHISDALGYFVWKEAGIRQKVRILSKTNLLY